MRCVRCAKATQQKKSHLCDYCIGMNATINAHAVQSHDAALEDRYDDESDADSVCLDSEALRHDRNNRQRATR